MDDVSKDALDENIKCASVDVTSTNTIPCEDDGTEDCNQSNISNSTLIESPIKPDSLAKADIQAKCDSVNVKNVEDTAQTAESSTAEPKDVQQYSTENVHYENDVAIYTDPATKFQYQWDAGKNEWVARENACPADAQYGFENDTHTYTADGIKYLWDKDKKAWFPAVDENFLAQYQMNYGFIDNTTPQKPEPPTPKPEKKSEEPAKKRPPSKPEWFDIGDTNNTNVYVSNLPLDITDEEFLETMQKCGLVMKDFRSGKMKIKLYTDPNVPGQLKGDGLCTYIKTESVELALSVLDGSDVRGHKIKVERAKFQMKGEEYNPALKPRKLRKRDKEKIKKRQEKLFAWKPEKLRGERAKCERVVILKNLFDPDCFAKDPTLILEYQRDIRDECAKCGEVRRVVIHDCHEDGVAQITMASAEEADVVVQTLNGRWFDKRRLIAQTWDGKTKFKKEETEEEIQKRIEKWDEFLEKDSEAAGKQENV